MNRHGAAQPGSSSGAVGGEGEGVTAGVADCRPERQPALRPGSPAGGWLCCDESESRSRP